MFQDILKIIKKYCKICERCKIILEYKEIRNLHRAYYWSGCICNIEKCVLIDVNNLSKKD